MAAASPLIIRGFPATDWMLPLRQMAAARRRCSAITKPTIPGATAITDYPKDGINDHVITGANTVNADEHGTKACWWYKITVPAEVRLRLHDLINRHRPETTYGMAATSKP